MKNLNQLRDEVYQINKENGWHNEERTFGELIALVHSEVSEALEDYRNGKAINEIWYEYDLRAFGGEQMSISENKYLLRGIECLGKPCGIPSELADIVIRILDICGLYGWDVEGFHNEKVDYSEIIKEDNFGFQLSLIHSYLSNSYEGHYFPSGIRMDMINGLDAVIQVVEYVCGENGINLEQTIQEKLAYNRTRGYKHGGKVI